MGRLPNSDYVWRMRLGVVDVGSNTVHLLVVDAHPGAQPLPATKHKIDLRLSEHVTDDGQIGDEGSDRLATFVQECLEVAEHQGVENLSGFVTSAIREAPNGHQVLLEVKERTGVVLDVLSGADEARLTFLAARRWFGWSAGTLLVADIGGGSLAPALGLGGGPRVPVALPVRAGPGAGGGRPRHPAGGRHRRRLARARDGHGRGPCRRGVAATRRWPGDAGPAARRPAQCGCRA